jgi:hypothetical protein
MTTNGRLRWRARFVHALRQRCPDLGLEAAEQMAERAWASMSLLDPRQAALHVAAILEDARLPNA